MIDTTKLRSPEVQKEVSNALMNLCKCTRRIDINTGGLDWEFIFGTLVGSYDNRISVKLIDKELYSIEENGRMVTYSRPLANYKIEIELSLHKAMLGHNVLGGSSRFKEQCRWFISELENILGVKLPDSDEWQVLRIDTAEIFNINPEQYFKSLGHLYYPRKGEMGITPYQNESVAVSTTMIYFKAYDKGKEFKKNDYKRVSKALGKAQADLLQKIADNILRIEVEIRHKKLKQMYGKTPLVADINDDDLKEVWDLEVAKILQFSSEFKKNNEVYNTSELVRTRLLEQCESSREARTLLGTWTQLATFGEQTVKDMVSKATLMRHKARLKSLGISWISTDIMLMNEESIVRFIPIRSDACCIQGEAPEVVSLLDKYSYLEKAM